MIVFHQRLAALPLTLTCAWAGRPSVMRGIGVVGFDYRPHTSGLLKKLDIQTDGAHEQVDVLEALGAHVLGKSLGEGDGVHDPILDC